MTSVRGGKSHSPIDLHRRDFLLRFCQGAGASLIPSHWWRLAFAGGARTNTTPAADAGFQIHPHYRNERLLDALLLKVQPGLDEFISEKYAEQIGAILETWRTSLQRSPQDLDRIARLLANDFSGNSIAPSDSRIVRSDALLEVRKNTFVSGRLLDRKAFIHDLNSVLSIYTSVVTAEFQITQIKADQPASTSSPVHIETRVRYEIVGSGREFYREQRIGHWTLAWELSAAGELRLRNWQALDETQASARWQVYADRASAAFGANPSFAAQMMHGTDYWRTLLDGACGIDIYGHNGVSAADIDKDGYDDLYICQPAGLPNRLYRNRGDGTFEDITESSGLGVLENSACAIFADFSNRGFEDVIVVGTNGPLLFLNEGGGKFRQKPDAFHFANPPRGTFTGAAVADYDRDGWLDIYFCLYSYYQGTGQYKYPSPYHDAENGPPNFLMCNHRDGTFRDVTTESGMNQNNTRYSFACGWNDYNRDGWPDLYVVNDFGRKNLYRNNGDGTFTDVAPQAKCEDVGAGMSVGWIDYDNDGAQDLYVADMWTAAGLRVSAQEIFRKDSPQQIRALYQKHAMGNSLLRNNGEMFDDRTNASGTGMGRWSWSSDALDFDHDGYLDLYIANGMVSGPSRRDLNSFFWRQVVAKSPDDARPDKQYEQGWNAINELIRGDGTWSGYERNVFYVNNRDGTFSDVSGALGLDFIEDGRSFALADFDHDGRPEICLKNRNAPQLRLLKNVAENLPPSIAFRLQGTRSNRDAIGAAITIDTGKGQQTRMLQAGSGFLSQHSKTVFFGLGEAVGVLNASIHWPSGFVQELRNLPANHTIWVEEGEEPSRIEAFKKNLAKPAPSATQVAAEADSLPTRTETWLLAPISAPDFSLPDSSGRTTTLSTIRSKIILLNFWTAESRECQEQLQTLQKFQARWANEGLTLLSVQVEKEHSSAQNESSHRATNSQNFTFPILRGSEDVLAIYNILYRQLFDRHRDLSLPTSFLINANSEIVKVYLGPIEAEHVERDFRSIPATDAERLARALPFPSHGHSLEFGRNFLSLGALYFQLGYLDQSAAAFEQAFHDDPSSAEALYGIGSVHMNRNENSAARDAFERALKVDAGYPDTIPDSWNNLGVIATREERMEDSIACFQRALTLNPHHLAALENLGNAYRLEKRWDDARTTLEKAVAIAPDDPEANYSLGMVFAQSDNTVKADEYLHRALAARPIYPEALNNLGILYLVTQRRDDAVASFERCIRVAPQFDQAYLNLARVYALEGARDKARDLLRDLLKQRPDDAPATQMLEQLQQ